MTNWHEIAPLSDLPLGSVKQYVVADRELAVAHTAEGIFAVEDICSHAEVPLSDGELSGCFLECSLHGSSFNLKTGVPTGPPAIKPIAIFPVQIIGEGDAALISVQVSE
jgi:3-phenylpropionate/trans-cinnamate dioxygenase ferredoxin subunit